MLTRILTSLIGLVVFFAVIFANQYLLYGAVTLVVIGMVYEMCGVMEIKKELKATGFVSALIICLGVIFGQMVLSIYAVCALFLLMAIYMHTKADTKEVMAAAFSAIFISTFMMAIVLIRKDYGRFAVILPFVCAWLTDTGAYFSGTFLGKHKLAPVISPKKTVEGSIGGIILSTIGAALYILIVSGGAAGCVEMLKYATIGFAGSILSQAGDLIASCIKRDFGKKDYGSILPGHGGILDRFDSVLFIMPFIYYALQFVAA